MKERLRELGRAYGVPLAVVLVCLLGAAAAFVLAVDVATARATLRDDDVRYRASPEEVSWSPRQLLPGRLGTLLLGVDDDVRLRRALRATVLSHPETPGFTDPSYVINRNDATAWLTEIVQGSGDPALRSRAANLLGVLSFSDAVADFTNRGRLLDGAAGRFRQAISLDPANVDAKHNLELTLASSRGLALSESGGGTNPSPGGKGARGAGAGDAGSGY